MVAATRHWPLEDYDHDVNDSSFTIYFFLIFVDFFPEKKEKLKSLFFLAVLYENLVIVLKCYGRVETLSSMVVACISCARVQQRRYDSVSAFWIV